MPGKRAPTQTNVSEQWWMSNNISNGVTGKPNIVHYRGVIAGLYRGVNRGVRGVNRGVIALCHARARGVIAGLSRGYRGVIFDMGGTA